MKRASRTAPEGVMNAGSTFVAPSVFASFTCGFDDGLDPPTAGCAPLP